MVRTNRQKTPDYPSFSGKFCGRKTAGVEYQPRFPCHRFSEMYLSPEEFAPWPRTIGPWCALSDIYTARHVKPACGFMFQENIGQQSFTKMIDQGLDMLVLSRKKDEKIVIGDSITLMVIEIRGDKVRLGIEAPRDVTVHREEIYEAIRREATPDK
jgi:carbon storage regulator